MPGTVTLGTIYVAVLAIGLVCVQLYYPPHVETAWRTRARWLFRAGAVVVVVLTIGRVTSVLGGVPV